MNPDLNNKNNNNKIILSALHHLEAVIHSIQGLGSDGRPGFMRQAD